MKKSLLVILTLLSTTAFANALPDEDASRYKEAADIALKNLNMMEFECRDIKPDPHHPENFGRHPQTIQNSVNFGRYIIERAQYVFLEGTSQPILSFTWVYDHATTQLEITSTSDFKKIQSFSYYSSVMEDINIGDFRYPKIIASFVPNSEKVGCFRRGYRKDRDRKRSDINPNQKRD
jgi:hypothetical protein